VDVKQLFRAGSRTFQQLLSAGLSERRPHLFYRLRPTQIQVHNHPPMTADSHPVHPHGALDNTAVWRELEQNRAAEAAL